MEKYLIRNISQMVTLAPLASEKRVTKVSESDLGRVTDAWLAIESGKIKDFGQHKIPSDYETWDTIDGARCTVLPGLVDSHTHPIFGGSRANEFALRLDGKSYQEIAAMGGGILSTVAATRNASDNELLTSTEERLKKFLTRGVTTVEAKTGYGLSVDQEVRLLKVLNIVKKRTPQTIAITSLALHALPPEHKTHKSYIDQVTKELLPRIAQEKLADWVDAFVEIGYFRPEDLEEFVHEAKKLGLGLRIHADEFADSGAASAAARWGAAAADHLECARESAMSQMAEAKVIATLLPGTSLYSKIPYAKARPFIERGCAVAIATDYNPGSCLIDNLPMAATLGAIHCGLNLAETVAAVTYVAAYSLRLHESKGALAKGHDADFVMYPKPTVEMWLADIGRTPPSQVWIKGKKVV